MDISVSGRHTEVPDRVRKAASDKIGKLSKYLDGMDRADVVFDHQRNPRIAASEVCEVTLEGHGHHVRAKVSAQDQLAAVDLVVEKLEHQLTKLKRKLVDRNHGREGKPSGNGDARPADDVVSQLAADAALDGAAVPRIVKAKRFDLDPMTADEAAQRMDLLGHEFFFFTDLATGRAAIVYRRGDGDVGLIEQS